MTRILSYVSDKQSSEIDWYQSTTRYLARFPHLPAGSMARRMHSMVAALDDFVGNTTAALKARPGVWADTLLVRDIY